MAHFRQSELPARPTPTSVDVKGPGKIKRIRLRLESLEKRTLLTAIVSVSPAPNSHIAHVSTSISATFDTLLAHRHTDFFQVHGMQSGTRMRASVEGDIPKGSTIDLEFAASRPFHSGEFVQVTGVGGVETIWSDEEFDAQAQFVWQFRTAATGGTGNFATRGQNLGSSETRAIEMADLDNDGDLDAWVANGGDCSDTTCFSDGDSVWFNDGEGHFFDSGQRIGHKISETVVLGDLDADGDVDAFVVSVTGYWVGGVEIGVHFNDGSGQFTDSKSLSSRLRFAASAALGDLDGDGDLDAYVGNGSSQGSDEIWWNLGSGRFRRDQESPTITRVESVALGDLEGDGDLDVFIGRAGANRVLVNDGQGAFEDSGQELGEYQSDAIDLADLDGDGDLDAFVVNSASELIVGPGDDESAPNLVWLNDGNGTFSNSGQQLGNGRSKGVSLSDVDGDGDLDAFVSNSVFSVFPDGELGNDVNELWLNDGFGKFTISVQELGRASSGAITSGDVDGDRDIDLLIDDVSDVRVWINQDAPSVRGDVDGDGVVSNRDIDALYAAIRQTEFAPSFDVNDDGMVTVQDVDIVFRLELETHRADVNLDGNVGFDDFLILSASFGQQTTTRADGDLNLDGIVDFIDFNILSDNFGEEF